MPVHVEPHVVSWTNGTSPTFGVGLSLTGCRKLRVGLAEPDPDPDPDPGPDPGPGPGGAVALQRERSVHDRRAWWKSGSATTKAMRAGSRRLTCRQRR